ncbi:MAG TPA: ABC transporter substrate-binding protein [Candidatus Binatia bacterium]
MKKKITVLTLGAMLFALCVPAFAQQPKKVWRIGFLSAVSPTLYSHLYAAFVDGMRLRGYVEGQNIVIETRWADAKTERLPKLATELVRLKVDLIVSTGGAATALAVKNATTTIPVVFVGGGDLVRVGLIDSLARPGGNLTGMSLLTTELGVKRLELLKERFPKIRRMAILGNPTNAAYAIQVRETQAAGKRIAGIAIKKRMPAISEFKEFVEAGGLMSYGTNIIEVYRRIAVYVDKILKGAKPAELPVEQPTNFDFFINLNTAKRIGVTIPPNVLARADKVIK